MTNNDIAHLTLEHLRALRNDFADFRAETRARLDRVDLRLTVIEQTTGNLYALSGSDRDALNKLRGYQHVPPVFGPF